MRASEVPKSDVIPFGILELDMLTGIGGVPTRKITEIFGPWSVGKSTLGLYLVRSAQMLDMPVLWADTEMAWENPYAEFLGVNTDEVELVREAYGEAYLDAIEEWVTGGNDKKKAHKNSLVVLDSVGHLTTRAELEKSAEGVVIGGQAKLMAGFVRRAKIWAALNNTAVVVLNHEYNPISFGGEGTNKRFPTKQPSGGSKLEYAKDLSIILSRTWVKENDKLLRISREDGTKGGDFIKAKIWKNKLAGTQDGEAVFALTFGQGIDRNWNMCSNALKAGIIRKEGNTYYFGDEKLCVGLPKLTELFKSEEFSNKIKELL